MRSPWSSWVRIAAITASLSLGLWVSTFGAFLVGAAMDDLAMRRTWGKVVVHPCAAAPVASEQPDDDGTAPPKSRL